MSARWMHIPKAFLLAAAGLAAAANAQPQSQPADSIFFGNTATRPPATQPAPAPAPGIASGAAPGTVPAATPGAAPAPAEHSTQEVQQVVESLFGQELRRAATSGNVKESLALCEEMFAASARPDILPAVGWLLCDRAYELAMKSPAGTASALTIMNAAAERFPTHRRDAMVRVAQVHQRVLAAASVAEREAAAHAVVNAWLVAGDAAESEDDLAEALQSYNTALTTAGAQRLPQRDAVRARIEQVRGRQQALASLAALRERLAANPADAAAAKAVLKLTVVDLGRPEEALGVLTAAGDAEASRNLPLALKPIDTLPPADLMSVGDWYRNLAEQAGPRRAAMLRSARAYYQRLIAVPDVDGLSRTKATLLVGRLDKELGSAAPAASVSGAASGGASVGATISPAMIQWAAQRDQLPADQALLELIKKLREANKGLEIVVAGKGFRDDRIAHLDLEGNPGLLTIEPLVNLPLRSLSLRGANQLKSIAALRGMKLDTLDLSGCEQLTSLAALEGMPLRVLVLNGCKALTGDLAVLKSANLQRLEMRGCEGLTSLNGVTGDTMRYAVFDGCTGLRGDLTALKGLKQLNWLNIRGCTGLTSLNGVQGLPLEYINARGCTALTADLSILKGMPARHMDLTGVQAVTNIAALASLPLEQLRMRTQQKIARAELGVLTRIATLRHVETGDPEADAAILKAIRGQ